MLGLIDATARWFAVFGSCAGEIHRGSCMPRLPLLNQ